MDYDDPQVNPLAEAAECAWRHLNGLARSVQADMPEFLRVHVAGCESEDCDYTAMLACPFGRTEHFWKDGCPACWDKPDAKIDANGYHPFRPLT